MSDEVSKLTARFERLLAEERSRNEKLINKLSRDVEDLRVYVRREKDAIHRRIDDIKDIVSWTIAVVGISATVVGVVISLAQLFHH